MNKVNLQRSRLIALTYPSERININTTAFFQFRGLPLDNISAMNYQMSVVEARNTIMRDHVFPFLNDYDWFIFVDGDNYPSLPDSEPFLDDVDFDVVGAQYEVKNKSAWSIPDNFHMGWVRIRSSILHGLGLPCFKFGYNEAHTKIEHCECDYFRNKLLENGASITQRGFVQHESSNHLWRHSS